MEKGTFPWRCNVVCCAMLWLCLQISTALWKPSNCVTLYSKPSGPVEARYIVTVCVVKVALIPSSTLLLGYCPSKRGENFKIRRTRSCFEVYHVVRALVVKTILCPSIMTFLCRNVEFHPMVFHQHRKMPYKEFPSMNEVGSSLLS